MNNIPLTVIQHAPHIVEYRIQHPGKCGYVSLTLVVTLAVSVARSQTGSAAHKWLLLVLIPILLYWNLSRVVYESVISLYPHGLQLETHRGIRGTPLTPPFTLFISRKFIALPAIADIIINEGLRRWNVRYYLVIVCRNKANPIEPIVVHVVYSNILPQFRVLKQVYLGLHTDLFTRENKRE
ncbi:uncharacterized protein EI90DRAFT_2552270 [Cantharellus anzutake]|uniref:uncharacterized protein n=1 Tax=Cantharellus anzutake TaxID=1750568 RepID=UPI001903D1EE|nr:uncharacterized protein EI90DRAFT_2552270 [Cantharellus anzutake]KAF8338160.1 hypothetical protein EI90DRAFT_2552270 [Cantharellus anzutake]